MSEALRGLYAVTPPSLPVSLLIARVEAALQGGVRIVQYREKAAACAETARALRELCRRHGALFIVNDDLALAQAVDADGVHLGGSDGDLSAARAALGPGKILGASCYADLELARTAQARGADYVAFGALYPSPSKPQAPLAPISLLARCRAELALPVCAIGGITLDNAPALIDAGADLVAVISDLFEAADVKGRALAFQRLFAKGPSHREPTTQS
jgi:thiamine-phosphate pyrophosphorylase